MGGAWEEESFGGLDGAGRARRLKDRDLWVMDSEKANSEAAQYGS